MKKKKNSRIKNKKYMKDSFSINKNTRRYEDAKTQMDEGGCLRTQCRFDHGLYAGPAFAEWIGTGSARAYILNGQVQTGWQQIDGKWYYLNEQGAPQIGWVKDGDKQYFCTASGRNGQRCRMDQWKNLLFWHTGQWRDGNGRCSINGIPYTFENDGTSFGGRKPRTSEKL